MPVVPGPEARPSSAPVPVRVTFVVAVVEAALLVGYAILVLVMAARGDRSSLGNVVLVAGLLALWAAGLAAAGRAVRAGRRWGRAPVVVSQIFAVGVGVPVVQGGALLAGGLIAGAGVAGLTTALAPQVTTWLTPEA